MDRVECSPFEALQYMDKIGGGREVPKGLADSLSSAISEAHGAAFERSPFSDRAQSAVPSLAQTDADLISLLSTTLMISSRTAEHVWKTLLIHHFPNLTADSVSFDNLVTIRSLFLAHRSNSWKLLHKLIHISNLDETGHAYQAHAAEQVAKLTGKGLAEHCLRHLTSLSTWIPHSVEHPALSSISAKMGWGALHRFKDGAYSDFLLHYYNEVKNCLKTLMILSYQHYSLQLNDLLTIFRCFLNLPKTDADDGDDYDDDNDDGSPKVQQVFLAIPALRQEISNASGIRRLEQKLSRDIGLQVLLLVIETLQLHHLYLEQPSSPAVLGGVKVDTPVDCIQALHQLLAPHLLETKVFGFSSARRGYSPAGALTSPSLLPPSLLSLCYFLLTQVVERNGLELAALVGEAHEEWTRYALPEQCLSDLLRLVSVSLGPCRGGALDGSKRGVGNERGQGNAASLSGRDNAATERELELNEDPTGGTMDGGEGESDASGADEDSLFLHATLLNELLQVLIQVAVLSTADPITSGECLSNLGWAAEMVTCIYTHQETLCDAFWQTFPSNFYPLSRLILALLRGTTHLPVYLMTMLVAMSRSSVGLRHIVNLFNQPLPLQAIVSMQDLRYRNGMQGSVGRGSERKATAEEEGAGIGDEDEWLSFSEIRALAGSRPQPDGDSMDRYVNSLEDDSIYRYYHAGMGTVASAGGKTANSAIGLGRFGQLDGSAGGNECIGREVLFIGDNLAPTSERRLFVGLCESGEADSSILRDSSFAKPHEEGRSVGRIFQSGQTSTTPSLAGPSTREGFSQAPLHGINHRERRGDSTPVHQTLPTYGDRGRILSLEEGSLDMGGASNVPPKGIGGGAYTSTPSSGAGARCLVEWDKETSWWVILLERYLLVGLVNRSRQEQQWKSHVHSLNSYQYAANYLALGGFDQKVEDEVIRLMISLFAAMLEDEKARVLLEYVLQRKFNDIVLYHLITYAGLPWTLYEHLLTHQLTYSEILLQPERLHKLVHAYVLSHRPSYPYSGSGATMPTAMSEGGGSYGSSAGLTNWVCTSLRTAVESIEAASCPSLDCKAYLKFSWREAVSTLLGYTLQRHCLRALLYPSTARGEAPTSFAPRSQTPGDIRAGFGAEAARNARTMRDEEADDPILTHQRLLQCDLQSLATYLRQGALWTLQICENLLAAFLSHRIVWETFLHTGMEAAMHAPPPASASSTPVRLNVWMVLAGMTQRLQIHPMVINSVVGACLQCFEDTWHGETGFAYHYHAVVGTPISNSSISVRMLHSLVHSAWVTGRQASPQYPASSLFVPTSSRSSPHSSTGQHSTSSPMESETTVLWQDAWLAWQQSAEPVLQSRTQRIMMDVMEFCEQSLALLQQSTPTSTRWIRSNRDLAALASFLPIIRNLVTLTSQAAWCDRIGWAGVAHHPALMEMALQVVAFFATVWQCVCAQHTLFAPDQAVRSTGASSSRGPHHTSAAIPTRASTFGAQSSASAHGVATSSPFATSSSGSSAHRPRTFRDLFHRSSPQSADGARPSCDWTETIRIAHLWNYEDLFAVNTREMKQVLAMMLESLEILQIAVVLSTRTSEPSDATQSPSSSAAPRSNDGPVNALKTLLAKPAVLQPFLLSYFRIHTWMSDAGEAGSGLTAETGGLNYFLMLLQNLLLTSNAMEVKTCVEVREKTFDLVNLLLEQIFKHNQDVLEVVGLHRLPRVYAILQSLLPPLPAQTAPAVSSGPAGEAESRMKEKLLQLLLLLARHAPELLSLFVGFEPVSLASGSSGGRAGVPTAAAAEANTSAALPSAAAASKNLSAPPFSLNKYSNILLYLSPVSLEQNAFHRFVSSVFSTQSLSETYAHRPAQLYYAYRLVLALVECSRDYSLLASWVLGLVQLPHFWEVVAYPLTLDAPSIPEALLTPGVRVAANWSCAAMSLEMLLQAEDLQTYFRDVFPILKSAEAIRMEGENKGKEEAPTMATGVGSTAFLSATSPWASREDPLSDSRRRTRAHHRLSSSPSPPSVPSALSPAPPMPSVQSTTQQLLLHALAFKLLAKERYGVLYELSINVASRQTQRCNALFVKLNESHRFLSWMKHYIADGIGGSRGAETRERGREERTPGRGAASSRWTDHLALVAANEGGSQYSSQSTSSYNFPWLLTQSSSSLLAWYGYAHYSALARASRHHYCTLGMQYIFNTCMPALHLKRVLTEYATGEFPRMDTWKSYVDGYLHLVDSLLTYNTVASVQYAKIEVIHAFKSFLDVFVLPGSRFKQLVSHLQLQQQQLHQQQQETTSSTHAFASAQSTPAGAAAMSSSPEVGSLSPLTSSGGLSPANNSPTHARTSAFPGDKRSYEIVSEILSHFSEDSPLSAHSIITATTPHTVSTIYVQYVKLALLLSMLHHQLKEIKFKHVTPQKSVLTYRETGSRRLTQDKMEIILGKLTQLYSHIFQAQWMDDIMEYVHAMRELRNDAMRRRENKDEKREEGGETKGPQEGAQLFATRARGGLYGEQVTVVKEIVQQLLYGSPALPFRGKHSEASSAQPNIALGVWSNGGGEGPPQPLFWIGSSASHIQALLALDSQNWFFSGASPMAIRIQQILLVKTRMLLLFNMLLLLNAICVYDSSTDVNNAYTHRRREIFQIAYHLFHTLYYAQPSTVLPPTVSSSSAAAPPFSTERAASTLHFSDSGDMKMLADLALQVMIQSLPISRCIASLSHTDYFYWRSLVDQQQVLHIWLHVFRGFSHSMRVSPNDWREIMDYTRESNVLDLLRANVIKQSHGKGPALRAVQGRANGRRTWTGHSTESMESSSQSGIGAASPPSLTTRLSPLLHTLCALLDLLNKLLDSHIVHLRTHAEPLQAILSHLAQHPMLVSFNQFVRAEVLSEAAVRQQTATACSLLLGYDTRTWEPSAVLNFVEKVWHAVTRFLGLIPARDASSVGSTGAAGALGGGLPAGGGSMSTGNGNSSTAWLTTKQQQSAQGVLNLHAVDNAYTPSKHSYYLTPSSTAVATMGTGREGGGGGRVGATATASSAAPNGPGLGGPSDTNLPEESLPGALPSEFVHAIQQLIVHCAPLCVLLTHIHWDYTFTVRTNHLRSHMYHFFSTLTCHLPLWRTWGDGKLSAHLLASARVTTCQYAGMLTCTEPGSDRGKLYQYWLAVSPEEKAIAQADMRQRSGIDSRSGGYAAGSDGGPGEKRIRGMSLTLPPPSEEAGSAGTGEGVASQGRMGGSGGAGGLGAGGASHVRFGADVVFEVPRMDSLDGASDAAVSGTGRASGVLTAAAPAPASILRSPGVPAFPSATGTRPPAQGLHGFTPQPGTPWSPRAGGRKVGEKASAASVYEPAVEDLCLSLFESSIITALRSLITYLEINLPSPASAFTLGSEVTYFSFLLQRLVSGCVVSMNSTERTVDVLLSPAEHSLLEKGLHFDDILYASPPLSSFGSAQDIHPKLVDDQILAFHDLSCGSAREFYPAWYADILSVTTSSRSAASASRADGELAQVWQRHYPSIPLATLLTGHLHHLAQYCSQAATHQRTAGWLRRPALGYDLYHICMKSTYVQLACLDHCTQNIHKYPKPASYVAALCTQIQDLQRLIDQVKHHVLSATNDRVGTGGTHVGLSIHTAFAGDDASTPLRLPDEFGSIEWLQFSASMQSWARELLYRLTLCQRDALFESSSVMQEASMQDSASKLRRRGGLRQQVDWVHSIDDIH